MFEEIKSEYVHKYDVLRTIVFELIHLPEDATFCENK